MITIANSTKYLNSVPFFIRDRFHSHPDNFNWMWADDFSGRQPQKSETQFQRAILPRYSYTKDSPACLYKDLKHLHFLDSSCTYAPLLYPGWVGTSGRGNTAKSKKAVSVGRRWARTFTHSALAIQSWKSPCTLLLLMISLLGERRAPVLLTVYILMRPGFEIQFQTDWGSIVWHFLRSITRFQSASAPSP